MTVLGYTTINGQGALAPGVVQRDEGECLVASMNLFYRRTGPHRLVEVREVVDGPDDSIEAMCAKIKAADDAAYAHDYMLDSSDCISVLRGTWKGAGS